MGSGLVYKGSQLIERLCDILSHEKADYYEESAIIYRNNPYFNAKNSLPFHFYLNNIEDICWKIALKKIELISPELELERININKLISSVYNFREDSLERVHIKEKKKKKKSRGRHHKPECEYENLMRIRGIPLIIESSLGGFQSLNEYGVRAVHETLLSRPYYIFIMPKEHTKKNINLYAPEHHIILPWDITKNEFIEKVKSNLERYGLRYTI